MDDLKTASVLVVTSTFPRWRGDAEPLFVYELSRHLSNLGMRVTVLAPRADGAAVAEEWENGIQIVRYPYFFRRWEKLAYDGGILAKLKTQPILYCLIPLFLLGQLWALICLCRTQRFDVIHAHWLFPQGLLALLACSFLRASPRVVVTSHGGDLYGLRGSLMDSLKRWVLKRADVVTVVSQAMRNDVTALTDGEVDSRVVSMGVNLQSVFIPPLAGDRICQSLLFVGRLVEKKGLPILLYSLKDLLTEFPALGLTVVGDGPEREYLQQLAGQLGIANAVNFVGRKQNGELVEFYRAASVFVLPSIVASDGDQEGLGLVSIEAMGCGCPVVAADLPAVKDVVEHEVNGLLFTAGSHQSLTAALRRILLNVDLARSLSLAGRQSVLAKYDWEIVARRYATILKSL